MTSLQSTINDFLLMCQFYEEDKKHLIALDEEVFWSYVPERFSCFTREETVKEMLSDIYAREFLYLGEELQKKKELFEISEKR